MVKRRNIQIKYHRFFQFVQIIAMIGIAGTILLFTIGQVSSYWVWQTPQRYPSPVNSTANEAYPCLNSSKDVLYFASDRAHLDSNNKTVTDWDIYRATYSHGLWGNVENLTALNSKYSESSPFLTADGNILYFASYREGTGSGKWDLYYAYKSGSSFTAPINLGPTVNSSSNEFSPCVTPDGLTLYFASDRPGGKGGIDVWYCTRPSTGSAWSAPQNFNALNSSANDFAPFYLYDASESKLYMYYTTERSGGAWDIYAMYYKTGLGWFPPFQIGSPISTSEAEGYPFLTSDHSMLLFSSQRVFDAGSFNVLTHGLLDIWYAARGESLPTLDFNGLIILVCLFSVMLALAAYGKRKYTAGTP